MKNLGRLIFTLFFAIGGFALAESRALLIGIDQFQESSANLRGPATDVRLMSQVIEKIGFTSNKVMQITDADATKDNILSAIDSWLIRSTTAEDRAIIFISSHGYQKTDQNYDEDDGCDEVILTHDMQGITDDEIAQKLALIPAKEILVIIDSCFSGTITKNFGGPQAKTYKDPNSTFVCNTISNKSATRYRDMGVSDFLQSSMDYLFHRSHSRKSQESDDVKACHRLSRSEFRA